MMEFGEDEQKINRASEQQGLPGWGKGKNTGVFTYIRLDVQQR